MLNAIIEKFTNIESSMLINLTDVLIEEKLITYPQALKTTMAIEIMLEVEKALPVHIFYCGFKNFFIIVRDRDLHLTTLRIITRPIYKQYIQIIKGEHNSNYKKILENINKARLIKDKEDTRLTECLVFQHYVKKTII